MTLETLLQDEKIRSEVAELNTKYNGLEKYVSEGLEWVAHAFSDSNNAVQTAIEILLSDETKSALNKYEGSFLPHIIFDLTRIARLIDKDTAMLVVRTIGRYRSGAAAVYISRNLSELAKNSRDKNDVKLAAEILSLDEILNTLKGYDESTEVHVVSTLTDILMYTKDKDAVIETAKAIERYGAAAEYFSYSLSELAKNSKDTKLVKLAAEILSLDEILNTLKGYDEYTKIVIAHSLIDIIKYTKDKEATLEAAKIIREYENNENNLSRRLALIAEYTKDKDVVKLACKVIKIKGHDVLNDLSATDLSNIKEKKLDDLIRDDKSLTAVIAYVKSNFELPLPDNDNLAKYNEVVSKYISKTYNANVSNLNTDQIRLFFSVDKNTRKRLARLVSNSYESGLKTYSISTKEAERLDVDNKLLPYLSVIAVTGSRNKDVDAEAYKILSKIVSEKTVRRARNDFYSNYKYMIPTIASYIKLGKVDDAIELLRSTGSESIQDVVSVSTNYNDSSPIKGKTLLNAIEDNNPLDFYGRMQIACVYLPNEFSSEGILNYCEDYYSKDKKKGFVLVRYDIGEKTLGSAICYMEDDTFLVDSVEGHRTFRKPEIFNAVYKDLIERAKEKGAKRIVFNYDVGNETAKDFIKFLHDLGLREGSVSMKLDTNGYLEAAKGNVKGYVLDLS